MSETLSLPHILGKEGIVYRKATDRGTSDPSVNWRESSNAQQRDNLESKIREKKPLSTGKNWFSIIYENFGYIGPLTKSNNS